MPAINNGSFYNTAGASQRSNSKQMVFLGIGIVVVIVATFVTYRYFTQGAGENAPVVKTEEAPGVKPVGEEMKNALPQEAQDVRNAVSIYTAIADVQFDTEFFNNPKFDDLVGGVVTIPEASPRPGRIFELWEQPQTGQSPAAAIPPPPPPPPAGGSVRIRR